MFSALSFLDNPRSLFCSNRRRIFQTHKEIVYHLVYSKDLKPICLVLHIFIYVVFTEHEDLAWESIKFGSGCRGVEAYEAEQNEIM